MKTIDRNKCFTLNGEISKASKYVTVNPNSLNPELVSSSHRSLKAAQDFAKSNTWELNGVKSVREVYEVIG